jgi:hypothetical protein
VEKEGQRFGGEDWEVKRLARWEKRVSMPDFYGNATGMAMPSVACRP